MVKMVFDIKKCAIVFGVICTLIGLSSARSGLYSEESPSSIRIEQCHDGCIKKVKLYANF